MRARSKGYVKTVKGEPPRAGGFAPVWNMLTQKGFDLIRGLTKVDE